MMQQHDFNVLIHGKEQRLNMSKMEEVVPRYKFTSVEDEELKKKA
jgi:hypothetical protein